MRSDEAFAGVLYAEDFDAPEPRTAIREASPPAEPVIIEPTFSLADLKRTAERAQEEGRLSARREAELEAGLQRTAALAKLAQSIEDARDALDDVASQAASATAETVLAMVAAMLPDLARSRGRDEANALLRLLLPAMTHEAQLVIRLHPSTLDALRGELAALMEDKGIKADWIASQTMQPGDVNVRWQGGGMIRDVNVLHDQIAALIAPEATKPTS